jgi:hypothetical protein
MAAVRAHWSFKILLFCLPFSLPDFKTFKKVTNFDNLFGKNALHLLCDFHLHSAKVKHTTVRPEAVMAGTGGRNRIWNLLEEVQELCRSFRQFNSVLERNRYESESHRHGGRVSKSTEGSFQVCRGASEGSKQSGWTIRSPEDDKANVQ